MWENKFGFRVFVVLTGSKLVFQTNLVNFVNFIFVFHVDYIANLRQLSEFEITLTQFNIYIFVQNRTLPTLAELPSLDAHRLLCVLTW